MDTASYLTIGAAAFIVGVFLTLFIALAIQRKGKRVHMERMKRRRKIEFSKLVLALILLTYFIGVGVGVWVVFIDFSQLGVVLAFIGTPTAAAIGFYVWKAKAENIIKIKQAHPDEAENTDFTNIHH